MGNNTHVTARRRLLGCLTLHMAYVGLVVIALLVRLEATRWGYLLTDRGHAGTRFVLIAHAIGAFVLLMGLLAMSMPEPGKSFREMGKVLNSVTLFSGLLLLM